MKGEKYCARRSSSQGVAAAVRRKGTYVFYSLFVRGCVRRAAVEILAEFYIVGAPAAASSVY